MGFLNCCYVLGVLFPFAHPNSRSKASRWLRRTNYVDPLVVAVVRVYFNIVLITVKNYCSPLASPADDL